MEAKRIVLKRKMRSFDADNLKATFLDDNSYDTLVTEDTDGYTAEGELLFRFRKNALPFDVVKSGYEAFKDSIQITNMRGVASGGSKKYVREDGTTSKTTVGNPVYSSVVGYMDESSMIHYCRKTAFVQKYFETFSEGVPFVKAVDQLYKELAYEWWVKQMKIATATNINYRIADTSFTTVTVNRNFQTAVHKDAGDYPEGFGNLTVYREGYYDGSYFCFPEYRAAVDMQNGDILFGDVHRWHGNTPFKDKDGRIISQEEVMETKEFLRVAFVMYYREYMINCKAPAEELKKVQNERGGFLKL
jgi:hypothetical protein